jgi:multidrug efflux pump subunit AcrA (membrane-fusion protein)
MLKALFVRLEKRPTVSFIIVLVILFSTVVLAHTLRTADKESELPEKAIKTADIFTVGTDQTETTVSAQVKKSGVTDIVALAPGVVKSIHVKTGQMVGVGQTLATLTNDYGSGVADLTKEKTRLSTDYTERTFELEKDIIELQKEIAEDDSSKSKDEEKAALKVLKLELERLRLGRSNAALDLAIAERGDAALRPKSLASGTVEYIGVRPGDLVSTGTVLMTIRGTAPTAILEAALPKATADALVDSGIAILEQATGETVLSQGYLARSENTLGLVMATYVLPAATADTLAHNSFVTLRLPLVGETEAGFLIPVDAIRSAADKTSVILMDENRLTKEIAVTLGATIGSSVIVADGLEKDTRLVLNASVLSGETIEPIQ